MLKQHVENDNVKRKAATLQKVLRVACKIPVGTLKNRIIHLLMHRAFRDPH